MADYYPRAHPGCGGEVQPWVEGFGKCATCGVQIEPSPAPDPAWNGHIVITVPVVPPGILDVVRRFNASQEASASESASVLDILREIDAQNEEGRARGTN